MNLLTILPRTFCICNGLAIVYTCRADIGGCDQNRKFETLGKYPAITLNNNNLKNLRRQTCSWNYRFSDVPLRKITNFEGHASAQPLSSCAPEHQLTEMRRVTRIICLPTDCSNLSPQHSGFFRTASCPAPCEHRRHRAFSRPRSPAKWHRHPHRKGLSALPSVNCWLDSSISCQLW